MYVRIEMNKKVVASVSLFVLLAASAAGLRGQTAPDQDRKAKFEDVLGQAEKQFNAGNYRNAAERFFFASKLAADRSEFSRVYFGLALSYYYLKDTAQCEKYIKLVLEVDPRKVVTVVFYPISFVQAFDRIRNELHLPAPGPEEAERVEPEFKAPEPKPPAEAKPQIEISPPQAAQPAEAAPAVQNPPPAAPVPRVEVARKPGGHFEAAVIVSSWSVNLVKGLFESSVVDKFSTEIRRVMSNDLRDVYGHYNLIPLTSQYGENLSFDSTGPNYGLDIRYYSSGWSGSFSIGLSFEQTRMKLAVLGTVSQEYTDTSNVHSSAEATVEGSATASVFSTNLSFRWDILPNSRVSPYFILGFGWAPFSADVTETYAGTFSRGGVEEHIEGTTIKSLADIASENDFDIPDAIVIVHLGLGLKANIYAGLSALVEAGLWDGFLLRFGVGYRL
jgi:hypothetical protein